MTNQPPFGCAGCDNRWGGYKTAHCGACHHTFSVLSTFDAHRQGSHSAGTRHCVDPASVGLQMSTSRGYPLWMRPGRDDEQDIDAA